MKFKEYIVETKSLQELSDNEIEKLIDLHQKRSKELNPSDPKPSRNYRRLRLKEDRPYENWENWFVWTHEKKTLAAWAHIIEMNEKSPEYESNIEYCWSLLWVNSDYQRQGIGTFLLKELFQVALKWNKTSISLFSDDESGRRFHEKIGLGIIAQEGHQNRLYLDQVDWNLMNEWSKIGINLANETIETFEEVPETYVEEFCKLYTDCLNMVPKGEEDWEAVITPKTRREDEEKSKKLGQNWITKVVREGNGVLSGLTEIVFNPENPYIISQGLTGVLPDYRGKGLGKWLKSEMMLYIRKHHTSVKFIQTGNADSNASMLSINNKMGFKKYNEFIAYKVTKNEMREFLSRSE